jgi:hypothetical protein
VEKPLLLEKIVDNFTTILFSLLLCLHKNGIVDTCQTMESQDADDEKSPRHLASKLQLEVAASLKNNGANTRAPCPMADLIFEMLFGRLWMQSKIVRSNKHAEEMFELIKLDHDATLDFYR